MRLATIASPSSACHYHRCSTPFKYLSRDFPQHEWKVSTSDQVQGFDCLYLYGGLRTFNDWQHVVRLKRQGVRLIHTNDDDTWRHPSWRTDPPTAEHVASVSMACELADLIVASTPALAQAIGKPDKTVVCPNLLEVSRYQITGPPPDDERIRCAWVGAGGHWADLQLIDKACCRIKEKWRDRVEFHFVGDIPDTLRRDWLGDGVHLTDWYPLSEHWYRLHCIKPHLVLAPLCQCPFNESKSNIRILEAWSLHSACIASPVGEYKIVRHYHDGLMACSDDEWFGHMDHLIQSRESREALALEGARRVRADWDWASPDARRKWAPLTDRLAEWDGRD